MQYTIKSQLVLFHLDYIIIFSELSLKHVGREIQLLQISSDAGVSIKLNKCSLFTEMVAYVGIIPWEAGNCHAHLLHYMEPEGAAQYDGTTMFFGLCNILLRHIPSSAWVADRWNKKLHKNKSKTFDYLINDERTSKDTLQQLLIVSTTLSLPRAKLWYM